MQEEMEPKDSEEALRASELRYRRLFETAKDGILILDAKTGQITDVNPFLVNLLGYSTTSSWDRHSGNWAVQRHEGMQAGFSGVARKRYIRYNLSRLKPETADPLPWSL